MIGGLKPAGDTQAAADTKAAEAEGAAPAGGWVNNRQAAQKAAAPAQATERPVDTGLDPAVKQELAALDSTFGEIERNLSNNVPVAQKTVRAAVANAVAQSEREDLSPTTRAHWLLRASAGSILLQQKLGGGVGDATASFNHLRKASQLAPNDPDVATNFGRVIRGMATRSAPVRFFINRGLGIDVMKEAGRAARMLAPVERPMAQLIRKELAQALGDDAGVASALGKLSAMPVVDVDAAQRLLDADSQRAADAKQ